MSDKTHGELVTRAQHSAVEGDYGPAILDLAEAIQSLLPISDREFYRIMRQNEEVSK